jgi:hypothetical protein
VAPSSSSTRKAARLAQKGKGKRVRFQGGTLFPVVVAAVLVVGLALIVYARSSQPEADAGPPQPNIDHWHWAYGLQLCEDAPNVVFSGALEEQDTLGNYVSGDYLTTGVHSHDDGVIHWHPFSARASGSRAQLGIFFDNYGANLTDDELELPEGLMYEETKAPVAEDFPRVYEEGETECDGEDATLKVVVWDDYTDPGSDQVYTSNFDEIPFDGDGKVVVVAFVPDDVDVVMPSWAADLPALGAADGSTATVQTTPDGSIIPDTAPPSTEPAVATTEAPDDTESVGATGPDESAPESSVPESSVPASSAPPTTE